jgi:transcription termination/antitermination protein NusA
MEIGFSLLHKPRTRYAPTMATAPFVAAILQLSIEKNIPEERVFEAVEAALAAAYRRDFGHQDQVIRVKMNRESGAFEVSQIFEIVADEESLTEKQRQILLADAVLLKPEAQVGEEFVVDLPHQDDFGRIAAQTAKQVIVQRIREIEREILFEEFKEKEHTLISASVQQIDNDIVVVNLGKINAVMPPREQIRNEYYSVGQRIRVYVKEVAEFGRGTQVIVSRADVRFIKELFALEIPEIQAGSVEIREIAREAGSRTKMAVYSDNPSIDPVGSCVGQRRSRIQAVLSEIGEEKIDIILWDADPRTFIENAMSPSRVRSIKLDEATKTAKIEVDTDQLSLAIGRGGQNVRLASRLTGYTIDILRDDVAPAPSASTDADATPTEE